MRDVLTHLIECLQDSFAAVADTAVAQLQECKAIFPSFPQLLSTLPSSARLIYDQKLQFPPLIKETPPALDVLQPVKSPYEVKSPKDALRTFSDSFSNGVEFGFLPAKLKNRMQDKENWKDKIAAISETEVLLKSLDSLKPLHPHINEFLGLISDLICDKNMKICTSGVNLLEFLVTDLVLVHQSDLFPVIQVCISRLGDSKILIRQAVFRCLRKIVGVVRLGKVMSVMVEGLKSSNWHIREEVLNVLLACMLTPDQVHDVDFLEWVPVIVPLIDDDKPKVRFVAQETLAVVSRVCGKDKVMQELSPLLDMCALRSLEEKFNRKTVPIVRDDYIEFPRVAPASAPPQQAVYHSPIPSALPTPSDTQAQFSFNDPFPTPDLHLAPEDRYPRRRLKSASRRVDSVLPSQYDLDSLPTEETSKPSSTRGSSLNPLRITRKRVIPPAVPAKGPESGYDIPTPTQDLTPLRTTKLKETTRVKVT